MDVLDKADITCDQTLVETDKVIKVSDLLGKPNIEKYFYALSKISDEKKLKIVFSLIAQESLCVCDIAYILDCSIATASHHLRKLYDENILGREKRGKMAYYFIKDDDLKELFAQLNK